MFDSCVDVPSVECSLNTRAAASGRSCETAGTPGGVVFHSPTGLWFLKLKGSCISVESGEKLENTM